MLENKAVNQKDWGLKGGKKKLLLGVFFTFKCSTGDWQCCIILPDDHPQHP